MNIALINIFDNEKYQTNLDVEQDFFILWNNYEIFKRKLREYNESINALSLEVLKLRLSNDKDVNEIKYYIKNDVLKINHKKLFKKDNELLIIYKLLSIKLRCLQIEEKLYEENYYLKLLLKKSSQFIQYRKQQLLNKINKSTENLRKAETYFTTKFESLFNKLHSNHKIRSKQHVNAGLMNHLIKQYINKEQNFQLFSKNSYNKLDFKIKFRINKFHKQIPDYVFVKNNDYNHFFIILQTLLSSKNIQELSISWTNKENSFIEIELAITNMQNNIIKSYNNSKYVRELDRTENNKNSNYICEIRNSSQQLMKHNKMNNVNKNEKLICVGIPKVNEIRSKFKRIKNMFTTTNEDIQLQLERINVYSIILENENTKENSLQKIYSEDLNSFQSDLNLNNFMQTDKSIQRFDTVSILDKINKFLLNYQNLRYKILNSYLITHRLNTPENKITVGIGESTALLFNQEVQVNNDYLTEINDINININDKMSSTNKSQQFDFHTKMNNFSKTKRKKYKKYIFSIYNKSNYTFKKMPQMEKIYQIVLQNKTPNGINFRFLESNKQIFLINSSNKTDIL